MITKITKCIDSVFHYRLHSAVNPLRPGFQKTCCIDATACELRKQYAAIFTVFLTYDAFHQGEQDSFY